jgi:uncharacterized NAD(P)/FAD-binding protein YdhS
MPTVVIGGDGFSGKVTAITLLQHGRGPLEILSIEPVPARRGGGLAYSSLHVGWELPLNIQAGRISLFRGHRLDFLNWITHEADRTDWPEPWKSHRFGESSAVPRRVYQQYLNDREQHAVAAAAPSVVLRRIDAEVTDTWESATGVVVRFEERVPGGGTKPVEVDTDQLVLATGHLGFVLPDFAAAVADHSAFTSSPYLAHGQRLIRDLPSDETAFIVGTALTAFDAARTLLANGHQGPIVLCSRRGLTHFVYPAEHVHDILDMPRPAFLNEPDLTAERVVEAVVEEYGSQASRLRWEMPTIPAEIIPERIIKGWEPWVVELVDRLPAEVVQYLLREFKDYIVTSRIGTIAEIANPVRGAMEPRGGPGQVRILVGNIISMTARDDGRIDVRVTGPGGEEVIAAGAVICAAGQEADYTQVKSRLWRNLVDVSKLAVPHRKTRLGVEVGEHGELVDAGGRASPRISVVGPARQGDEIQRNGRLGGFTFSIGTIRNQAFCTAITVLRRLGAGWWSRPM